MKTRYPISGPLHLPTLAYPIAKLRDDDTDLHIGIRPMLQTARYIGHRDDLVGYYYVSIVENYRVAVYRRVELTEEFSPEPGEFKTIEMFSQGPGAEVVQQEILIPGLTPVKAAEHHTREYARNRDPAGPALARLLENHRPRFIMSARDGFEIRCFTESLELAEPRH